jgi:pyruvate dehydrogenase E2 component (dihydrolipoamide acetyltransferase)
MAVQIIIPRLGWSMEEGTFGNWLKSAGEQVHAGEPLFSLESDKVTMDVESLDAGILYLPADAPHSGGVVKVGQLIGYLLVEGEAPPRDVPVTPRARRVADELGVNLSNLPGSGKGGRVREQDVRAAAKQSDTQPQIPITALRRAVAERMTQSRQQTVPVTLTRRVDASRLASLRNRWKLRLQPQPAPSFNDIVAKIVAAALGEHPTLGGRWEGDRIVLPGAIHIGIAVDTEHGLLAPVIRDVANLTLLDLAHRSRNLIDSVRRREIQASDMQDAVFTISNLGSFGVEAFTPIINFPETAILGLGAMRWEPMVLPSGQIVAREQMMLSLTFDHRVVDGAPAARFLQTLAALIEEPPAAVHCP